jgi:sec-independent protein translocase protein TatB
MFGIGFQEILIILVVVLIIFGPKKLPELARLIGKGLAEFRRASNDLKSAIDFDSINHYEPPPRTPAQQPALPQTTSPAFADDEIENADDPEPVDSTGDPDPEVESASASPDPSSPDA